MSEPSDEQVIDALTTGEQDPQVERLLDELKGESSDAS